MSKSYSIGTISSQGIGIAQVYIIEPHEQIAEEFVTVEAVNEELERLYHARKKVKAQLEQLIAETQRTHGEEQAELFKAHLVLFEDQEFEDEIKNKIIERLYAAEYAVDVFIEETCREMLLLDEYFQERAIDIKDLGRRLIATLKGHDVSNVYKDIQDEVIIFAHELTPSMTAQLDTSKVVGFVTETGGVTSHVSFIAQSLDIPAIVGAKNILSEAKTSTHAIIDAIDGYIILDPDEATIQSYKIKQKEYRDEFQKLLKNVDLPARTIDGTLITLLANIGSEQDVDACNKFGAEGIGLFRTEFLFMEDRPPSEEKQFEIYKNVIQKMGKRPVTIRTLDIGGDKPIPFLSLSKEDNPFLGYRALRIYADHAKIVGQQLRAILRASAFGSVRIMVPMVISIKEVYWFRNFIKEIQNTLIAENHQIGEYYIGIMVETPSVAIMSDLFIQEVDFFSIGSNDLVQYTLAVDRGNEQISELYQPFHPAIVRLLSQIIESGNEVGKSVSICGDMGGEEHAVLLLLGLGLVKISMVPNRIPIIKNLIRNIELPSLKKNIQKVTHFATVEEIRKYLDDVYQKIMH